MTLSKDVQKLLNQRYLQPGEDWNGLVKRVVDHVCAGENIWYKQEVTEHLTRRIWLPNSPCLVNSGTKTGGLFACFVVGPDEDTLEHHVEVLGDIAAVGKRGGGCGFTGTNIRPENSPVSGSVHGFAYGPNWWAMQVSNYLDGITQGGFRKMALMYTMRSDHPDLNKFIDLKQHKDEDFAYNFNQSVMITDEWMEEAVNGDDGERLQLIKMAKNAWNNGDPGALFHTTINENTPYKACGCKIEATNPCQPDFATVLTPDGIKTLGEVGVGDIIWSGNQWTKIVNKWSNGVKPVYKYTSSYGEFIGTQNHHVFQRGERIEVRNATHIDSAVVETDDSDQVIIDTQTVLDGIVLGDGSVHKASNNLVYLCVGQDDYDYFDDPVGDFITRERTGLSDHAWEVNTTITHNELPYTYERAVPDRFFRADKNTMASFLRGLFSANGYCLGNRIGLKQTSEKLIKQVQQMLSALGIASYVTQNKPQTIEWDNGEFVSRKSYDLNISSDRYKFVEMIGFVQKYKNTPTGNVVYKKSPTGLIQRIDSLGNHEVFDITVSTEDHSYWTGGLRVSNCGEQPIPSYGSCNLGSINISHEYFYDDNGNFDYARLARVVMVITRFLDNVGSKNVFPNDKFKSWYEDHRPIGVGIMGYADALLKLKMRYGDDPGLEFLSSVMDTIQKVSYSTSEQLGKERGVPAHCEKLGRRNITTVSIAPTGSIGFIAECSHSIEPIFSPVYQRTDERGETYLFSHPLRRESYFVSCINDDKSKIPTWKQHVDVQSTVQRHCDSAVSKTVNMNNDATVQDVLDAFIYAWRSGCKGITVYRDGSRQFQVLEDVKEEDSLLQDCPSGVCEL